MKIAVYAICKNEEKHIDRFIEACDEADQIVVVDTGSDDDSYTKLQSYKIDLYREAIKPWRFDMARNKALSYVDDDVDFCISIDLDEILQPGWRQAIESAFVYGNNCLTHWHYEKPSGARYRECRTHSRHGWSWRNRIHEVLHPSIAHNGSNSEMVIVHDPDVSKPRSIYLPLLDEELKENPHDPRLRVQRSVELYRAERYSEALDDIKLALEYSESVTWQERAYYCIMAADTADELGSGDAYPFLLRAVTYAPSWRDTWYSLGKHYYKNEDYRDAHYAFENAISVDVIDTNYQNQDAKGPIPFLMAARSAYWAKNIGRAKSIISRTLKLFPDDISCRKLYAKLMVK